LETRGGTSSRSYRLAVDLVESEDYDRAATTAASMKIAPAAVFGIAARPSDSPREVVDGYSEGTAGQLSRRGSFGARGCTELRVSENRFDRSLAFLVLPGAPPVDVGFG
jgi:hypothetical protein